MALERQIGHAAHWSPRQYEDLFAKTEAPSNRFAWIAETNPGEPAQSASTLSIDVLGFMVAHRIDDEWELENIAVARAARRQGVAVRLLAELIVQARCERGNAIILEVRESNDAARALYCKLGFVETGLRKSYYSEPAEAAILCRLSL